MKILIAGGNVTGFEDLITFVKGRPDHIVRYAIDISKTQRELSWIAKESLL